MESSVLVMMDIGEALIPYVWMLRVVYAQDVHDHAIEYLCLAIILGLEGHGLIGA